MRELMSLDAKGETKVVWTQNQRAVPLDIVPTLEIDVFRQEILHLCAQGARLVALFASEPGELIGVLARDAHGELAVVRARLAGRCYQALSPEIPAAQAFEREIFEIHGVRPEGHPWLKPLRRHADLERPPDGDAAHAFFQVEGTGVHEVAVGPVHAGIIEPGHFRFLCAGEKVLHLEIQLGYQHRGVEDIILRSSPARRKVAVESIAGDTVVGHSTAHAAGLEALSRIELPLRAQALRGVALELERIANHVGDLGALCNDVGYLPGASWLGRLRGELLNLLMEWSGNRYGRGLVVPGGVRYDLASGQRKEFAARLKVAERDFHRLSALVLDAPSVASRFEQAGPLSRVIADLIGLVGPAARASGCDRDVRRDHAAGIFRFAHVPVALTESGDVMARALVRVVEAKRSLAFAIEQLGELPDGAVAVSLPEAKQDHLVVSLVEGWRGETAHVAMTGRRGQVTSYKIVDPSFHNWFGLAMAMRDQPISDFPLCNKSFNLSYAGHDL